MYIKSIELLNFRNIKTQKIEFAKGSNVIIGQNAQGKTNILESIYTAANGRSFRTHRDAELINNQTTHSKIKVVFYKNGRNQTLQLKLAKNEKKQIQLNEVPIYKYADLFGVLSLVLFSPEDLKLAKGGPAERRKYIDREISQIDARYLDKLINYHKVLSQRNKLLKSLTRHSDDSMLDIYDIQLSQYAAYLIEKRQQYLSEISALCQAIHMELTEQQEQLTLLYHPVVTASERREIAEHFVSKLQEQRHNDIKYGYSTVGVHKENIAIAINRQDVRKYASQGQQRSVALTLKMAEIELIKRYTEHKPILLLDDVMSELDTERQTLLMKKIKETQTLLTTTDLHGLTLSQLAPFKCLTVQEGHVISEREVIDEESTTTSV